MDDATLAPRPKKRRFPVAGIIAILVVVALQVGTLGTVVWALANSGPIGDRLAAASFTPSPAIAGYVARSTMTPEAKLFFYATHPAVDSKKTFDALCSSDEEGVGTLGCYLPRKDSIHLFDITDTRLDGMEEVIASHEMLHAAWVRTSNAEQATLAPLLEAAAKKLDGDAQFTARMAFYAKSEPGERINELHSILGTEVADLGPVLEKHYAVFFSDRAALVAMHTKSNQVFVDLAQQTTDLVAQLATLRSGVETDYAAYTAGYDQLDLDVASFNSRADSGDFTGQSQFNRERAALLTRKADLDALFTSLTDRQTSYDALLVQLDALNADAAALNSSINITPRTGDGL